MEDKDIDRIKATSFLQGMIVGVAMLAIAMLLGNSSPKQIQKYWEAECVKRGHAEWVVGDNNKDIKFVWK